MPSKTAKVNDGTILTINEVKRQNKPFYLHVFPEENANAKIKAWRDSNDIKTINIAGPRESQIPGIYAKSFDFLDHLIDYLLNQASL
jgi:hypothetical protein